MSNKAFFDGFQLPIISAENGCCYSGITIVTTVWIGNSEPVTCEIR